MKKIMCGEEAKVSGKVMLSSAEGIFGYLLSEDEAYETCYFGYGEEICSTCEWCCCEHFIELEDGVDIELL